MNDEYKQVWKERLLAVPQANEAIHEKNPSGLWIS
jgi:hypothetical protein